MANLRDIRRRRKGAQNTRKITKTMELVASSKLRKAQDAALASRPYAEGLRDLLAQLAGSGNSPSTHPLLRVRPVNTVAILVASADRGLCGAFNANLVAAAIARMRAHQARGRKVEFVALGKKAAGTLNFLGFPPVAAHSGVVGATRYIQAEKIANETMARFESGAVDLVEVIYARFVSAAKQTPESYVMLPAGAVAEGGEAKPAARSSPEYIPDGDEVLAAVVPLAVRTALFSALLQTSAGEHAARRAAMKNATDAAGDMVKDLTRTYNRGRQGKITQEIAEIVGAVEAMA
jgi:F-type H+-transporting ATPase subunit gamma